MRFSFEGWKFLHQPRYDQSGWLTHGTVATWYASYFVLTPSINVLRVSYSFLNLLVLPFQEQIASFFPRDFFFESFQSFGCRAFGCHSNFAQISLRYRSRFSECHRTSRK
jgi:hypothetical protein